MLQLQHGTESDTTVSHGCGDTERPLVDFHHLRQLSFERDHQSAVAQSTQAHKHTSTQARAQVTPCHHHPSPATHPCRVSSTSSELRAGGLQSTQHHAGSSARWVANPAENEPTPRTMIINQMDGRDHCNPSSGRTFGPEVPSRARCTRAHRVGGVQSPLVANQKAQEGAMIFSVHRALVPNR